MRDASLRLVLFDCDGTLVDGRHAVVAAVAEAMAAVGRAPPPDAAIVALLGLSLDELLRRLLPGGADDAVVAEAAAAFQGAYQSLRAGPDGGEPLFPGIGCALDRIAAAGCLLGVATGMARRPLLSLLEAHGIRRCFATLQTADDGPGKPAPDMVLRAMAECGTTAASTILVGDTTYDMEMAGNAGIAAVGVAWGHHPPPALRRAGARLLATTPADLPRLVLELLPEEGHAPGL